MKKKPKASPTHRQVRLHDVRTSCSSENSSDAALILERAHDSATALLKAFDLVRANRGGKRGMSTDEEQDLLRAMVVMVAAGVDGMIKQLVRDTLPILIERDELARNAFEKYLSRQLRNDGTDSSRNISAIFLAKVLSRASPQQVAIEEYVRHLTGGSLQSSDALYEVVAALGLWPQDVGLDRKLLDPIFGARNKIIHELDIDLEGKRRKRNLRSRQLMVSYANRLLLVAEGILSSVDRKSEAAA